MNDYSFFDWSMIIGLFALMYAVFAYTMMEATKPSEETEKRVKLWIARVLFAIAVVALAVGFSPLFRSR